MSFSFRNLFSQEASDESNIRSDRPGAENQQGGSHASGDRMAGDGQAAAQQGMRDGAGFQPNPQPTDRGDFTALFSNPDGTEGDLGQEQVFRVAEVLPFIPPALASRGNLSTDELVRIPMPANGSRDVKLSVIYQAFPHLFATAITALNDSVVTLPQSQPRGETPQIGAPAGGLDSLVPARETGGLPGPRNVDGQIQGAQNNQFWTAPEAADPAGARPVPAEAASGVFQAPAQAASGVFQAPAQAVGVQNNQAEAPGNPGFGMPEPSVAPADPGFFNAPPEPAPGAEHLSQSGNGVGAGDFGFPVNGPDQAGANPFSGESAPAGGTQAAPAANWGFGDSGGAGREPQNVSNDSASGGGPFPSVPPGGDAGNGFGAPPVEAAPPASGYLGESSNPFAQPGDQPAMGGGAPVGAGDGRTVDLRLRDLFSRQPVQVTGIDPMGIPQDAIVKIPLARVETQLGSGPGSVSMKLPELAALADPVAAAVLMRGNQEAVIELPEAEVFRQTGVANPVSETFPAAGALEASPPAVDNPFAAAGFDTLFSQQAKKEAAPPPEASPAEPEASENPFLQPPAGQMASPTEPASFPAGTELGGNPFAGQGTGVPVEPTKAAGEEFSGFLPPRAAGTQPEAPAAEVFGDSTGNENGPVFPSSPGSFLEELENGPGNPFPAPESPAAPPSRPELDSVLGGGPATLWPTGPENPPVRPNPAAGGNQPVVRDVELRAVFGTTEVFTLQRVADLTAELVGVASCFVSSPQGMAQAPAGDGVTEREQADSILRGVRELARITGVQNAETFTIHTDQGVVSVFVHGEACLTVRHEQTEFDPGVREKLILVVRGFSQLIG